MALKDDLVDLKSDILSETQIIVSDAVNPVKTDIANLKTELSAATARVTSLEQKPAHLATGVPACIDKALKDLRSTVDSMDPAHKRIAFIGWSDGTSAEDRIKSMEAYMSKFPTFKPTNFGNDLVGPYNNKMLGKSSFVEFASADIAKKMLEKTNKGPTVDSKQIEIKKTKTKQQKTRNYFLIRASELIKEHPGSKGKEVKIVWGQRQVQVDLSLGFQQDKIDNGGAFSAPYDALVLP